MKLLVVVPAYNEEQSLPGVIRDIEETCPGIHYLVVNDGSGDGTAALCRQNGYNCLDIAANLGLSGAFQAGMMYAAERGYDAVLQFDADGQHAAKYIRPLADKLAEGYDIVIGSRFITVKKPITLRMAGSFLISFAIRFVARQAICDPTGGMRVYSRRIIEQFATQPNYNPEPDTLCHLIRCGAKVCEVQVEVAERTAGKSYFNVLRSARYMAQMALSILLVQWFRRNDLEHYQEKG